MNNEAMNDEQQSRKMNDEGTGRPPIPAPVPDAEDITAGKEAARKTRAFCLQWIIVVLVIVGMPLSCELLLGDDSPPDSSYDSDGSGGSGGSGLYGED